MEEIENTFKNINTKIEMLNKCMELLPNKAQLAPKLAEAKFKVTEIEQMSESVKKVLELHNTIFKANYDSLINRIYNVQMRSLHVINHLDEREAQKNTKDVVPPKSSRVLQEIVTTPASVCKPMMDRCGAKEAFSGIGNTPKIYMKDYAKSPFALRSKPIALQFYDFEAEIVLEDFAKVPSYIKGRTTCDELRQFLEIVVKCFNDKYQLANKQRSVLKVPMDITLWTMYRDQAILFEGKKFITQGDISRCVKIDKKVDNKLQMLRHLQIIKEQRKSGVIYYFWNC